MVVSEKMKYEEVLGFKFGFNPIGKPKMFSYVYFIDGLLIDTGHSKVRNSILMETNKLDIEQIFISHHHEDHTGNIEPIKKKHNCNVFGSAECGRLMKNPPKISLAQQLIWGNRAPFSNIITADKVVKTNKFSFNIIPIPGHASDMVALYEPKKKWLFSADLYINHYIGYFLDNESILDQIKSIKNILRLDFNAMFCGHNPQLTDAKPQLIKKLNFLESTFDTVASLHKKGYSAKNIFKQMKLKENWSVKIFSGGHLSKLNPSNPQT